MGAALRRVVKLGGSLLRQADLADRWRHWYDRQSPRQTLVVVGGGGVADAVAEIQRIHARMTDAHAHWLCIRAMQLNAELVVGLLPEAEYVGDLAEFMRRPPAGGVFVVDPWSFMQADARGADPTSRILGCVERLDCGKAYDDDRRGGTCAAQVSVARHRGITSELRRSGICRRFAKNPLDPLRRPLERRLS